MDPLVARTAGLDVGDKRIGVAVSDPLAMTAQPLGVVQRKSIVRDIESIRTMLADYELKTLVAGLPLKMDGSEGEQSSRVRAFCNKLEAQLGISVTYQDERLTTAQSERMLIDSGVRRSRRREIIDAMAATLILQSYLDGLGGDLA